MSEDFTEKMVKDPYKSLGSLYAETVSNLAIKNKKPEERLELVFTGNSMGSNFAAEAASVLLKEGSVTQERNANNSNLANLRIDMYAPAGLNESPLRTPQIGLGFVAEGLYQMATSPTVRAIAPMEPRFLGKLKEVLHGRGIETNMDKEQADRKNKVVGTLGSIVTKLLQGVPVEEGLVANKIVGSADPTQFSFERNRKLKKQKKLHPDSLGSQIIRESHPNQRTFGINMPHTIPFFRPSEYRRWDKVAGELVKLKEEAGK